MLWMMTSVLVSGFDLRFLFAVCGWVGWCCWYDLIVCVFVVCVLCVMSVRV